MELRFYQTERGTIISDHEGNILDLATGQPNGHAIYERKDKKFIRSNHAYSSGQTITVQHQDDLAQLTKSQENPAMALDLIGSFPLPITVNNAKVIPLDNFRAIHAQFTAAKTAYDQRVREINHTYEKHAAQLRAQLALLTQQKEAALSALSAPSLDAVLFS